MRNTKTHCAAAVVAIVCSGVVVAWAGDEIFTDGFEGGSICAWSNKWYPDIDADQWGDSTAAGISVGCPAPSGWAPNNGDCDDLDPLIYPGVAEVCDGDDNNCNGLTDDGDLCGAGYSCCDGFCLDTQTDPEHCGVCGHVCDLLHTDNHDCESGDCQVATCDSGYDDCNDLDADGCETNIDGETSNCGACGIECDLSHTDGHTCAGGDCLVATCDAGYDDCNGLDGDGCEVNTDGDATNCGSCGSVCNLPNTASHACVSGECEVHSCTGSYEDCNGIDSDGCEINLDTDLSHCGGCGQACNLPNTSSHHCWGGMCRVHICDPYWGNCDGEDTNGCEAFLWGDESNCGTCGYTCPGYGQSTANVNCVLGGCQFSCRGEWFDVNGNPNDGCEVSDSPTGNHIKADATYLGSFPCYDSSSNPNIAGKLVSDGRTHESPGVSGFDSSSGSAPDWYKLTASGGICTNDIVLELEVSGSQCPDGYRLTVETNIRTRICDTGFSGSCGIDSSSGEYSDDTSIHIKVSKTVSASCAESVNYTITGHL